MQTESGRCMAEPTIFTRQLGCSGSEACAREDIKESPPNCMSVSAFFQWQEGSLYLAAGRRQHQELGSIQKNAPCSELARLPGLCVQEASRVAKRGVGNPRECHPVPYPGQLFCFQFTWNPPCILSKEPSLAHSKHLLEFSTKP